MLALLLHLLACSAPPKVGVSRIEGSVALDGVENASGVTVFAFQYGELVAETQTADDGTYQLLVPAGIYEVVLHDEWSLELETKLSSVLVESERQTTLPLRTLTPVGRLVGENMKPIADCSAVRLSMSVEGGRGLKALTDTSDEILATVGSHPVVFSYRTWSTTVEAVVIERAGTTTVVAPPPPQTSSAKGRAHVIGTIEYNVPGFPVTLSGTCTRSTSTDAQGSFSFGALPAGDFKVLHPPPPSTVANTLSPMTQQYVEDFALAENEARDLRGSSWFPYGTVKGLVVSQTVPDGGYEICGSPYLELPPQISSGPISLARTDQAGRYELRVNVNVASVGICGPSGDIFNKGRLPLSNAVSVSAGYNQVITAPDIVVP
jgi:hypothetical protein